MSCYYVNSLGPRTVQDIKKCIKEKTILYDIRIYFGVKLQFVMGYFTGKICKAGNIKHYEFRNSVSGESIWIGKQWFDRLFYNLEDAMKEAMKLWKENQ